MGLKKVLIIIGTGFIVIGLAVYLVYPKSDFDNSNKTSKNGSSKQDLGNGRTSTNNELDGDSGDSPEDSDQQVNTSQEGSDEVGSGLTVINSNATTQNSQQSSGNNTNTGNSNNSGNNDSEGNTNTDTGSDPDPDPDPGPDPDPDPDPDPPANQPPTAPTIINATYLSGPSVLVRITPATDSDGSVASHSLYRNGSFLTSTTSSANPILIYDHAVSAGVTYQYTARATDNESLQGGNSNTASVTIPSDTTPPTAPTNFRITSAYDSDACRTTFAWNASTDNAVAQGDLWYILTSPLNESYIYTWTQNNPYTLWFCFDPGTHNIYLQATDGSNNSSKVGPVTIVAP